MPWRPLFRRLSTPVSRAAPDGAAGLAVPVGEARSAAGGAATIFHRRTPLAGRLGRFARIVVHLVGGLATTAFVFPRVSPRRRQALIARWSRQFLHMLHVEPRYRWHHDGGLAGNVLIVANHVSWLDIMVLNTLRPARFIAKAELRRWPVAGRMFVNVGTLFIDRGKRSDTHSVNRHTVEALSRGDVVAVFPEGTTSDGRGLLKFHSSLLQPIVDAEGYVQPAVIRYRTPDGEHSDVPAYCGGLTFLGSFWQVTGERKLVAELHLLPPLAARGAHRRALSAATSEAIRTVLESAASVPAPGRRAGRRA